MVAVAEEAPVAVEEVMPLEIMVIMAMDLMVPESGHMGGDQREVVLDEDTFVPGSKGRRHLSSY